MPADAISVYKLQNVRLLLDLIGDAIVAEKRRVVILCPAKRRIIQLQIAKDPVIKFVLAR